MPDTSALVAAGFSAKEAAFLLQQDGFHQKTKKEEEFRSLISKIAGIYGWSETSAREAILNFPQFADLDHSRVIQDATKVYGSSQTVKNAILRYPPFTSLDHSRVMKEAKAIYGDKNKVRRAILAFPQFANLDHARVMKKATKVYGKRQPIKRAILAFPQFAGLKHSRVLREQARLGRMAGLSKKEVIEKILASPFLASCSARRYLAGLDVGRKLAKEGILPDKEMLRIFLQYAMRSPYVPGTKRLRISQTKPGSPEPPLLKAMRKSLAKMKAVA